MRKMFLDMLANHIAKMNLSIAETERLLRDINEPYLIGKIFDNLGVEQ